MDARNYDEVYEGEVTMHRALTNLNTVAVRFRKLPDGAGLTRRGGWG